MRTQSTCEYLLERERGQQPTKHCSKHVLLESGAESRAPSHGQFGIGAHGSAPHSRARGPLKVVPGQCSTNSTVFSGFDAALQPGVAPGGLAAAADLLASTQKQSTTVRFVVDSWFSYDITGLADDAGAAPDHRLSLKEQNDPSMTIDLALVRNLAIQANVTGTGIRNREVAARHVFQRVKPAPTVTIRGLEDLCQPLWTIPFLDSVVSAEEFFASQVRSKWTANHWLIIPKLY